MAADSDYSEVLERLADSHQQRVADSLVALEGRVANLMADAPTKAGRLFDLEWAVSARTELRAALEETYLSEVDSVIRGYGAVSTDAAKMLGIYGDFTKLDAGVVSQLQRLSFQGFEAIGSEYLDVLANEVYQSTLTGRNFNDTVKNLRQTINGVYINSDDAEAQRLVDVAANGTAAQSAAAVKELQTKYARDRVGNNLRRYSTQMAQDSLMQFDASINTAIGKQSGATKWKYYGSTVRDSRQFCVDHAGKVFTEEEIAEDWSGSWKGKASGDPFIVRGGYNCRHHWRPVFDEELEDNPLPTPSEPVDKESLTSSTPKLIGKEVATAALSKRAKLANKGTQDRSAPDKYISNNSSDLPDYLASKVGSGSEFPVRFKPYGYKRGDNADVMGNASFGTVDVKGLSTEALSILTQALKETDDIARKFKAPAIRGITPMKSKKATASMGDGMLSVNSAYWNPIAKQAYESNDKLLAKTQKARIKRDAAQDLADVATEEYRAADKVFLAKYPDYPRNSDGFRGSTEYSLVMDARAKIIAARKASTKAAKEYEKARQLSEPYVSSAYLKGGDIKDRPFSAKQYYNDPADKFRSTIYHEYGHTVHQEYWRKLTDGDDTSFERYLNQLFYYNGKRATQRGLFFPTKYSEVNPQEWWAENFSLYNMGRKDLVDERLLALMDKMVESKSRIKVFDGWDFESGRYA